MFDQTLDLDVSPFPDLLINFSSLVDEERQLHSLTHCLSCLRPSPLELHTDAAYASVCTWLPSLFSILSIDELQLQEDRLVGVDAHLQWTSFDQFMLLSFGRRSGGEDARRKGERGCVHRMQ